ncbi:MAG: alpha/beta fold hydrolase BchO [Janthinobacterium lividum]
MSGAPRWDVAGRDWPNRAHSRFVDAGGLRWHVQVLGEGPVLLLLHGTGAATHSWRALAPLLARRFTVVAPDLPGHGFTAAPPAEGMSLPGMARLVAALLGALRLPPVLVAGHSAGAAVGAQMAIDGLVRPAALMSLNGALLPLPGRESVLFPAAARLLSSLPVLPWIVARQATQPLVDRMLSGTGSRLDPRDARLYARLFAQPRHVAAALRMMARWDLNAFDIARLRAPLTLVAGERDGMIPPSAARQVADMLPGARLVLLPGLGHLAHEEDPDRIAALLGEMADVHLPPAAA